VRAGSLGRVVARCDFDALRTLSLAAGSASGWRGFTGEILALPVEVPGTGRP
jgi:hypothetical protein